LLAVFFTPFFYLAVRGRAARAPVASPLGPPEGATP
jgi:hypothetical protein